MRVGENIGGRFVPEREVAAGGFGRIFQARDEHTGGRVALKVVSALHGESTERFAREALLRARMHHPNIVRYVAHGRADSEATRSVGEAPEDATGSGTLRDAKERLGRRAARIADPRLRKTFLAYPDSARTLALPG